MTNNYVVSCNCGAPQCGVEICEFGEWYEVEEYIDGLSQTFGYDEVDEWLVEGNLIVRDAD